MALKATNLTVKVEDKEILKNTSLELNSGDVKFLFGKNGAGKSTFAQAIMGNPQFHILSGELFVDDEEMISTKPEDRAKKGLFVSFQNPPELEGVSVINFLHTIYVERFGNEDELSRSTFKFRKHLMKLMDIVGISTEFLERSFNVGFSGGEKKRMEILQLLLLRPKYVILDEIDSGLDIHAMSMLENVVKEMISGGSAVLFISHNIDLISHFENALVSIIDGGEITQNGGLELVQIFKDNSPEKDS